MNTPFKVEVSELVYHDRIKGTVDVISRDIPFKEELIRFITVQLKTAESEQQKNVFFLNIRPNF